MCSNIHEPINLGNPTEVSILDFARLVKRIVASKSKIVFKPLPKDDPKQRRPDISRAKKKLEWKPRVGLEEGLSKIVKWFSVN